MVLLIGSDTSAHWLHRCASSVLATRPEISYVAEKLHHATFILTVNKEYRKASTLLRPSLHRSSVVMGVRRIKRILAQTPRAALTAEMWVRGNLTRVFSQGFVITNLYLYSPLGYSLMRTDSGRERETICRVTVTSRRAGTIPVRWTRTTKMTKPSALLLNTVIYLLGT